MQGLLLFHVMMMAVVCFFFLLPEAIMWVSGIETGISFRRGKG
jgi:hypothetical protein